MDTPECLNTIALFAGGAGLELGLRGLLPACRVVAYVEREAYACEVLASRMEEERLAPAPIWTDVSSFDGFPWRGVVDCVAGGFPCQDVSNAGKRAGITGARSGLWRHFKRIVEEVQPRLVFVENVAALRNRGLETVLTDLASLGFDAEWGTYRAADVGAPHGRDRIFILAHRFGAVLRDEPRGCGGAGGTSAPESTDVGAQVADDDDDGFSIERRSGVFDGVGETRRDDADGRGGASVDDPQGKRPGEGRAKHAGPAGEPHAPEPGREVAHSIGYGLEGRLSTGPAPRATGRCPYPLEWPPGPDDLDAWARVIAEHPELAPGVESPVRGVVDGLASGVVGGED